MAVVECDQQLQLTAVLISIYSIRFIGNNQLIQNVKKVYSDYLFVSKL